MYRSSGSDYTYLDLSFRNNSRWRIIHCLTFSLSRFVRIKNTKGIAFLNYYYYWWKPGTATCTFLRIVRNFLCKKVSCQSARTIQSSRIQENYCFGLPRKDQEADAAAGSIKPWLSLPLCCILCTAQLTSYIDQRDRYETGRRDFMTEIEHYQVANMSANN